jgi:hypothetical protein
LPPLRVALEMQITCITYLSLSDCVKKIHSTL